MPVSTGFAARALERFAQRLAAAGFDAAMKTALAAEPVMCGDETPVNIVHPDTGEHGAVTPGAPHVVTLRTPDERLVWLTVIGSRSKTAIKDLGVLDGYTGCLVRDDYAAWHQFDAQLAGVRQCVQHLFRHLQGVLDLHKDWQAWAENVRQVLREAGAAVEQAKAAGRAAPGPQLLARLRKRYDDAVRWGIITNRHRDWPKGNHPGYNLAKRLHDKAEQVWLFTRQLQDPLDEQRLGAGTKRPEATSGRLRILAHHHHARQLLPHPLIPRHRTQPRLARHRRHSRRPARQPLAPRARHGDLTTPVNGTMTRPAPRPLTSFTFSVAQTAVTPAPRVFRSWTAAEPIAPVAP